MDEVKYVCAICGKEHEHIEERIQCETKCLEERKEAEKKRERDDFNKRYVASRDAVENSLAEANEMIHEHLKEFGALYLSRDYYYLSYLFCKSFFHL